MLDLPRVQVKTHLLPILALIAVTFVIYSGVLSHDFVNTWDDDVYVTANEAVRGFSLSHLRAAFTQIYSGNYAPVQIVSYMLDYTFWGYRAGGFLLSNVVYHAINGILFYWLLIRIQKTQALALVAALLFLCHPVQVESVAWVSQRKNLLAMLFFLISFHCYLGYHERKGGKGWPHYGYALLFFMVSLLAKAITVIMAPIVVLYEQCFNNGNSWRRKILPAIPFFAAAVAMSLVTFVSQTPGRAPYFGGNPLSTVYTMLPIFVRYLRMVVWPSDLCASYTLPVRSVPDLPVLLSALFFLLLGTGSIYLYHRRRDLFFWFLVFFIGLAPVSQVIPIMTLINDRYLYFPMLGASVLLAEALLIAYGIAAGRVRILTIAGVCAVVVAMSYLTFKQAAVWENSITLWSDVTGKYPGDTDAWNALGDSYLENGDRKSALSAYKNTIAACDSMSNCQYYEPTFDRIGSIYRENSNLQEAREYFDGLVVKNPNYPGEYLQLAKIYYQLGDYQKARENIDKVLRIQPDNYMALELQKRYRK